MISLNGMAHLVINVSQWNDCKPFYKKLMPFLGMEQVFDGEEYIYFVGSRTAVGISRCSPKYEDDVFEQRKVGLHHFCLRSKSKEDVDTIKNDQTYSKDSRKSRNSRTSRSSKSCRISRNSKI